MAFKGKIGGITFEPPSDRALDKDRRRTLRGSRRSRRGRGGSGPANKLSAKEAELRQRRGRHSGRRSSRDLSPRVTGGRRIGYGGSRGRYGAPRLPRDGPKFGLKALVPLRAPRLSKDGSLRGLKALAPPRDPLSIEAPDSLKLAPIRGGNKFVPLRD